MVKKKKKPLPRFEIDRKYGYKLEGEGSYHYFARFLAKNGKEIWRTSEVYTRPSAVIKAITLINRPTSKPIYKTWE